jgi:hypothetical protein
MFNQELKISLLNDTSSSLDKKHLTGARRLKKNKYLTGLSLFFLSLLFILISPNFSNAQGTGIRISPVRVEEMIDPGQTLIEKVKVTNDSDTAKQLFVYLRDFKAEGETGAAKLIVPGSEKGNYLSSWIDASTEGYDFLPRQEREISFKINVPADTGPGGYYGAIIFGTEVSRPKVGGEDKGAAMATAQQVGCLILLQIKGDVTEEASIREFSTNKYFYSTPFKVDFIARIENLGNVHIKPHGTIDIKNMLGKEVGQIRLNDSGANVLPKSIRRFEDSWEDKLGFGLYTASMGLTFGTSASQGGQGMQSMFAEKTFWILPWKIILPVVIGLGLIIFLFSLLLRTYKHKTVKRALEQMGIAQTRYVKKYYGPSPSWRFALVFIIIFLIVFLLGFVGYFLFIA